jgi:trimethylamine--corrinoid protein Co-methyltransferase
MLTPHATMLSKQDKQTIHEKSLVLLQKVGVKFNSKKAIDILADAGCDVDKDELIARFPPEVIEQAIKSLPSQFPKAAMDPAKDFVCGDGNLYYTAPGQCPYFRDLETRERRPATLKDLEVCTKLVEELDLIQEMCPMVLPDDVHPSMRGLRAYEMILKYSTKHTLGGSEQLRDVPYILELMDVILGDRSKLKERPIMTLVINPSSPLLNGGTLVDVVLEFTEFKLPIFLQFLPLAGATSPITLAGTVVQSNAEFLGNIALYQTASPGWPIIWALATGALDMRSGRYVGGAESVLMTFALIEMAKFYGVPCNSFGSSSSEANSLGYQNGVEAMFGLVMFGAMGGVDNFWFPADMDGFNLMDLANVVLATEPMRQLEWLMKGMQLDDEHIMLDTMIRVGHEGSYLKEPSTKKYYKTEHLMPDLFPRETIEAWEARHQSEEELALERVRELLKNHKKKELPGEVEKEIDKIIAAAEKDFLE